MPGPNGVAGRAWARAAFAMFGVGWGANQFAPMLTVYRIRDGLSEASVTAMYGVYALGLIPSLLVAGPYSDRRGRRVVLRPVVVLSVAASLVLIAGADRPWLLYLGRFLAGVASGSAFSAGSAWVKELSEGAPDGAGARRATVALSAGFGGGPFCAGLVAQWLPHPRVLPYVVHIALMALVIGAVWMAPETVSPDRARRSARRRLLPRSARHPRFTRAVAPWSPWVFGTATIGFATLPALVARHAGGVPIAFNGAMTGLTLLSGILSQPPARWLAGRGHTLPPVAGLLAAVAGLGLSAVVAVVPYPWYALPAAVLLGAGYGILLVSGLWEVERLADEDELAALVAIFYALIYLGFAVPFLIAVLAARIGYVGCFLSGAAIVAASVVPTIRALRAHPAPRAHERLTDQADVR
ncbi:MFS transporter [Actinoallomurus sp. CA-150999]|uniref:MFS transporter n=1 Tax=Actinoallomurus sp. CA-150999 TaxID=3239887 RepID=UPI003D8AE8D4